jgi:phosphohistidine swiveling domain-containing protein
MNVTELSEKVWIQNWSIRVGLVFCSWYGDLYTKDLKKRVGRKFTNTFYLFDQGVSSQFYAPEEIKSFVAPLVNEINQNPNVGKEWVEKVLVETKKILVLIDSLKQKKDYVEKDFLLLQEALYSHVVPNLLIKRAADYLSKESLDLLLGDFQKARIATEPVYTGVEEVVRLMEENISRKEKISKELVFCLTRSELLAYLKKKGFPKKEVLEQRLAGCVLWYNNGKEKIFVGEDFSKIKNWLLKPKEESVLKGKTAYAGSVSGVARIILHPKRYAIFNEGDILVTGMTRPEFLPLMEKASAFVTDAGGILSHAAITAREMKKPCVIGTTSATKVLKDGMKITVDATKGIVVIHK